MTVGAAGKPESPRKSRRSLGSVSSLPKGMKLNRIERMYNTNHDETFTGQTTCTKVRKCKR